MAKSTEHGMQTFDQALFRLFKSGEVTYEDALHHADSPNDLRLMIKLDSSEQDPELQIGGGAAASMSLEETEDDPFA